jgi:hypothetical protein
MLPKRDSIVASTGSSAFLPGVAFRVGMTITAQGRSDRARGGTNSKQSQIAAILKAEPFGPAQIKPPSRCLDFGSLLTTEMGVAAR